MSRDQKLADIRIAVTLAEHAAGLLTAITRETPRLGLGPTVAVINRRIQALQSQLIQEEKCL